MPGAKKPKKIGIKVAIAQNKKLLSKVKGKK